MKYTQLQEEIARLDLQINECGYNNVIRKLNLEYQKNQLIKLFLKQERENVLLNKRA